MIRRAAIALLLLCAAGCDSIDVVLWFPDAESKSLASVATLGAFQAQGTDDICTSLPLAGPGVIDPNDDGTQVPLPNEGHLVRTPIKDLGSLTISFGLRTVTAKVYQDQATTPFLQGCKTEKLPGTIKINLVRRATQ